MKTSLATSPLALLLTLLLALLAVTQAAVPDAARKSTPADGTASTTLGSKKLATTTSCDGAVAFSGVGLKDAPKLDSSKHLAFRSTLLEKGVGWKPEDGEFVCYCPGTYQFAFAGDATAKLVLKKKTPTGSSWTPVVAGSHHVVLLDVELGEKVAVFLEGGSQASDLSGMPAVSFSGFRVGKKQ